MTGPGAGGSRALRGRDRVRPARPDWAAPDYPPGAIPLPVLAAGALSAPGAAETADRLAGLDRERDGNGWGPEAERLRERGARVRRETLADLEGHLARLTERAEANGVTVHRAATPAEGRAIVGRIARDNGVTLAVKSKSMATEEMDLNRHLERQGIEVVETDLGEYIIQVADERPSHIIAPAVHKSRADVARLFGDLAGEPVEDEPHRLTAFARERLREDFRAADMGITGVNFAAADTGTLALTTNEGNARMVTSRPRVHVAVMTVEKVIPRFTDLAVLYPLLAHAGTRQALTVYQTMLNGPRRAGERDGPEELHLVILDNGRTRLPGTRYEEVLACIRCGACQTACPVYRTVGGGHGYGATYGGPIGAVLSPLLADGGEHRELPFLSSLCGKCYDVCPVRIPLPDMLVDLRADYQRSSGSGPRLRPRRLAWRAWAAAWRRPGLYRLSIRAARTLARLAGPRLLSRLPGARSWTASRTLPPLTAAGSFRAWARGRTPARPWPRPEPDDDGPAAPTPDPPGTPDPPQARGTAEPSEGDGGPGPPGATGSPDTPDPIGTFAAALRDLAVDVHLCADRAEARRTARELAGTAPVVVDGDLPLPELTAGLRVVDDLWRAEAGITGVVAASAATGTLALAASPETPRGTSLVPPVHIALVPHDRVLPDVAAVFTTLAALDPPPSNLQLISGPSSSGDIEMKLVRGVHGPASVHVVLFPDEHGGP